MSKKIKVAILFGGRSAEHEVSLESAVNVINAMNKDKYEPVLIGIDRQGTWFRNENALLLLRSGNADWIQHDEGNREIAPMSSKDHGHFLDLTNREQIEPINVIFQASAISIDIEVGEFREATTGHPIIAPFLNISDETLPVASNNLPLVSISLSRHWPTNLSIVL